MLILLDIDGVMVPASSWKKPEFLNDGFPAFSNRAVSSLNKILFETQASIILTTSHKHVYPLPVWNNLFKTRGIIADVKRLDDNSIFINRKEEILNWLNKNSNIESFVIIDDDKSLNGLPYYLKEKLISTSPMIGLTEEDACKAIEILEGTELLPA